MTQPVRVGSLVVAVVFALLFAGVPPGVTQHHPGHHAPPHASPYAGEEGRGTASLSPQEVEELLAGHGMGLAKAAERNHYPGPLHVLELAEPLGVLGEQRVVIQAIFDRMQGAARQVGAAIVDAERRLDEEFAAGRAAQDDLRARLAEIGRLRGELRFAHLRAHLETRAALNAEQVRRYDELRGYAAPDPADGRR